MSIRINNTLWTLVAVYGPNNDEPQFFTNLQLKIESLGNSSVIIGGDWNVPLNYSMDTLNYMHKNNRLLRDEEYIKIVKDCIDEVIGQYKTEDNENMFDIKFSIDDQLFWETLKIMLRGKIISYSTFKKKERENIEFELESKLTTLYQNGGTHEEEISKLESELKNIREEKVKGIFIRAKAKWNIEGERSTRYFCNLEKDTTLKKVFQN